MDRFVILAAPRTGSNLLCTLLQSHPDVLCHHEVFNPGGIFVALPLRDTGFSLGTLAEREADPLGFLQRVWNSKGDHQCIGFKMTHIQQAQVFDAVCSDPAVCKIVLKRKARLKTYVSRLLAEDSGEWEDYRKPGNLVPPRPVEVDYRCLKQSINENNQYYAVLDERIRGPRIDLYYETLFDKRIQQSMLEVLNLNDCHLEARSRHQNPFPLRELIANRESLAEQLSREVQDRSLLAELDGSRRTAVPLTSDN